MRFQPWLKLRISIIKQSIDRALSVNVNVPVRPHAELVSVIVYLPQTRTLESDNDWYASDDAFVGEHNSSTKCAPGWYYIYYRIETVFPFSRLLTYDIHSSNMDTKHCFKSPSLAVRSIMLYLLSCMYVDAEHDNLD